MRGKITTSSPTTATKSKISKWHLFAGLLVLVVVVALVEGSDTTPTTRQTAYSSGACPMITNTATLRPGEETSIQRFQGGYECWIGIRLAAVAGDTPSLDHCVEYYSRNDRTGREKFLIKSCIGKPVDMGMPEKTLLIYNDGSVPIVVKWRLCRRGTPMEACEPPLETPKGARTSV
jgi:hypothetical protein